jgi:hypothetical protein
MQKQDKAFTAWLNHVLAPAAHDGGAGDEDGAGADTLGGRRMAARMKGAMVACYRRARAGGVAQGATSPVPMSSCCHREEELGRRGAEVCSLPRRRQTLLDFAPARARA